MTQAELAAAAEVGPNYVPRIERGEMTPSVDAAFRLSRALGLTLDDLCSPKAKRDPFGSATRQIAALSDTDLAGMKRTLDAVETVRKALREPPKPKAEPTAKPTKEASPKKRSTLLRCLFPASFGKRAKKEHAGCRNAVGDLPTALAPPRPRRPGLPRPFAVRGRFSCGSGRVAIIDESGHVPCKSTDRVGSALVCCVDSVPPPRLVFTPGSPPPHVVT